MGEGEFQILSVVHGSNSVDKKLRQIFHQKWPQNKILKRITVRTGILYTSYILHVDFGAIFGAISLLLVWDQFCHVLRMGSAWSEHLLLLIKLIFCTYTKETMK